MQREPSKSIAYKNRLCSTDNLKEKANLKKSLQKNLVQMVLSVSKAADKSTTLET